MRVVAIGALTALFIASGAPAQSMNAAAFHQRAVALQKKGPLALFSSDLKLLMDQVKADLHQIRGERLAAKAAGKQAAFCPPGDGAKLTEKDILAAMEAVPPAERHRTSTKDALLAFLVRRHPCPNGQGKAGT